MDSRILGALLAGPAARHTQTARCLHEPGIEPRATRARNSQFHRLHHLRWNLDIQVPVPRVRFLVRAHA